MKTQSALIVSVFFLSAYAGCAVHRIEVKQYGEMHAVLSGGADKAVGVVGINEVLKRPNAIAVGALAGLAGEITICDGKAWIARPSANDLSVEGPLANSSDEASMLTVSHVNNWNDIVIDRELGGADLEQFIGEQAVAAGIDTSRPFPFILDGALADCQIHVINGACPMRPGNQIGINQKPWRKAFDRSTRGRIIGFYARDAVGKLTHPGTSIHAHALIKSERREITGHVERVAMARGGMLKLPRVRP